MNKRAPKYPLRFFRWFCDPDYVEDIEGDLLERFEQRTNEHKAARWLLTMDVLRLFRPGIIRNFEGSIKLNNYGMFKHNLKIAFRNLTRQKSIAFINIGGLVLGLLITLMITLWVQDELSWNMDNENYDRVVRVMQKRVFNKDIKVIRGIPRPLETSLRENYNDVFEHLALASFEWDATIAKGEDIISVRGILMQSSAPQIMSLDIIDGNMNGLREEAAILLSKSAAKAIFGDDDAINQSVNLGDDLDLIVRGVYEDIPSNSSFSGIGFIGSWDYYEANDEWLRERAERSNWASNINQIFAVVKENSSLEAINDKIKTTINDNLPEINQNDNNAVFLHPMEDWHLKSSWKNGIQSGGEIVYVRWFSLIGLLVLFLACINFMNLSTAQSIRRAKEVGIRKSIGSIRHQLIAQFMTESTLVVFLSFLAVTGFSYLITPYFNHITDKQIVIPLDTWQYWGYGLGLVIVVGLLAGSYPAIYLSSFRPIQVLKGTYQNQLSASFFRKALVVFQFSISIALIIGTIVISRQIDHSVNRPLGYDNNHVLSVERSSPLFIQDELKRSGAVTQVAETSNPLTASYMANNDFDWVGKDPSYTPLFNTIYITHDFGKTINWEMLDGRDFNADLSSDSSAIVLNETAAKVMGVEDPVGTEIKWQGNNYKIIGIVNDLLTDSPFKNIQPTFYITLPDHFRGFTILRLNDQISSIEAIEKVTAIYKEAFPDMPFEFEFVSDAHNQKFRSVHRIGSLSSIFSSFSIVISCLGLFGLASFMVEQRTKEIGIRKVLGASTVQLWKLVSWEFVLIIFISSLVAIPVALWTLKGWLEGYEYRVNLEWWVFVIACTGSLLLTMATTSFKSLATIRLNPAKTLKDE